MAFSTGFLTLSTSYTFAGFVVSDTTDVTLRVSVWLLLLFFPNRLGVISVVVIRLGWIIITISRWRVLDWLLIRRGRRLVTWSGLLIISLVTIGLLLLLLLVTGCWLLVTGNCSWWLVRSLGVGLVVRDLLLLLWWWYICWSAKVTRSVRNLHWLPRNVIFRTTSCGS